MCDQFIVSLPDESTVRYEETSPTEPIFNTGENNFSFRVHIHIILNTNIEILAWKKDFSRLILAANSYQTLLHT